MPETQNAELDFSALSVHISEAEKLKHKSATTAKVFGIISMLFLAGLIPSLFFDNTLGLGVFFVTSSIIAGILAFISYSVIESNIRISRFAEANRLTYNDKLPYDNRPGIIFGVGNSRTFGDVLSATGRDFTEIGNYSYTTGSGKNETTHNYSYIKIQLPRKLPNIILDSKKNNFLGKFSNLPSGLSADQKLRLEGDFNSHFTLFAPSQYKTDALYIFTPDVMQAMVTYAKDYDCEIVDDTLYLYKPNTILLSDEKELKNALKIARIFKKEVGEQTDYYSDQKVGDRSANLVAEPGKRLTKKLTPLQILSIAFVTLFILYNLASALVSAFTL